MWCIATHCHALHKAIGRHLRDGLILTQTITQASTAECANECNDHDGLWGLCEKRRGGKSVQDYEHAGKNDLAPGIGQHRGNPPVLIQIGTIL